MSNARSSHGAVALLAGLGAALAYPFSQGADLIHRASDGLTLGPGDFSSPRYIWRGPRKVRVYKRKLHRTTRAMTAQGRILQHHFDSHRLTRSQMKKFYAGKPY